MSCPRAVAPGHRRSAGGVHGQRRVASAVVRRRWATGRLARGVSAPVLAAAHGHGVHATTDVRSHWCQHGAAVPARDSDRTVDLLAEEHATGTAPPRPAHHCIRISWPTPTPAPQHGDTAGRIHGAALVSGCFGKCLSERRADGVSCGDIHFIYIHMHNASIFRNWCVLQ